jgi:hypothetical protein
MQSSRLLGILTWDAEDLHCPLVGDPEAPFGVAAHHAVVDRLPRLGGVGLAWLIEKPARNAGRK